jgi:hypothetical protein
MKRSKKKAVSKLPVGYNAPPGSARERAIRRAAKLYKSGNKQAAFRLREQMERRERAKKGFKNKKAKYSKKG